MHLNWGLLWSFGIVAHSDMFQTIDLAIIELSVLQAQPLQHATEIDILIDGFDEEGCNLMKMIFVKRKITPTFYISYKCKLHSW